MLRRENSLRLSSLSSASYHSTCTCSFRRLNTFQRFIIESFLSEPNQSMIYPKASWIYLKSIYSFFLSASSESRYAEDSFRVW